MSQTDGPKLLLLASRRWAPTSYKWGEMGPYKWPYNWLTKVITLVSGVITLRGIFRGNAVVSGKFKKVRSFIHYQLINFIPDRWRSPTTERVTLLVPYSLAIKTQFSREFSLWTVGFGCFLCPEKRAVFFSTKLGYASLKDAIF